MIGHSHWNIFPATVLNESILLFCSESGDTSLVRKSNPRRIFYTEEKAKVVTAVWGTECIKFLAALALLHQDDLNVGWIHLSFIWSWCNSSFSSYYPGAITFFFMGPNTANETLDWDRENSDLACKKYFTYNALGHFIWKIGYIILYNYILYIKNNFMTPRSRSLYTSCRLQYNNTIIIFFENRSNFFSKLFL